MIVFDATVRSGDKTEYGPFDVEDAARSFSIMLDPWTDEKVFAGLAVELLLGGAWHSMGGIHANGRPAASDGRDARIGYAVGLYAQCSICGAPFPPGHGMYTADNRSGVPLANRGALTHSTIALKGGRTLQEVNTKTGSAKASVEDYKLTAIIDDDDCFARTFHTPVAVIPGNRQVRWHLEVSADFASRVVAQWQ